MSEKQKIIAILSDTDLESFRNIEDNDDRSEAKILDLIATLSCRLAGEVRVQLCTPE